MLQRATHLGGRTDLPRHWTVDLSGAWPYQVPGIRHLQKYQAALLADEPGLGKTFMVLRALPRRARVVVVCPKSVRGVWVEEAAIFRPDMYVTVGEPLRRPRPGEILVVSWDSLPEPPPGSSLLVLEPMDDVYLVGDEVHMVKSDDAIRSDRWRRLSDQCGVVWGLTGTPMLGSPEDLWGVIVSCRLAHLFSPPRSAATKPCESCAGAGESSRGRLCKLCRGRGRRSVSAREHFVDLCDGKPRFIRDQRTGDLRRVGFVWGTISPVVNKVLRAGGMLRRFRQDVRDDLPEVQRIDVPVDYPEDLRDYLDEINDKWAALGPEEQLGGVGFELTSSARKALAKSRIDAACDFAQAHSSLEQPLLVFSAHVEPIEAIGQLRGARHFTGETPDAERQQAIDLFKAGKLRILAMTIATGGVGLNLTQAAAELFIDLDWTPGKNQQAELRCARPGQIRPVVPIWRLRSTHPLEVRLYEVLKVKDRLIGEATGRPHTRLAASSSARRAGSSKRSAAARTRRTTRAAG